MVYDGTGYFDLSEGVTLEGYDKSQLENMIYIRISTVYSLSEKISEYTADTEDGHVRSMRKLFFQNYNGPSIMLPDEIPTITMSTVVHIKDLMPGVRPTGWMTALATICVRMCRSMLPAHP